MFLDDDSNSSQGDQQQNPFNYSNEQDDSQIPQFKLEFYEELVDSNIHNDQPLLRDKLLEQQKIYLLKSQNQIIQSSYSKNDQFQFGQYQTRQEENNHEISQIQFNEIKPQLEPDQHFYQIDSTPYESKDVQFSQLINTLQENVKDDIDLEQVDSPDLDYMIFDVQTQNQMLGSKESDVLNDIIDMNNIQTMKDKAVQRYPKPLLNLHFNDPLQFLTSPCPTGGMMQCSMIRDQTGLNHFFPKYKLFTSQSNKFLMAAEKKSNTLQSYYLVSMHQQDLERGSAFYLGKLRGVKSDSQFVMYDNGENPKEKSLIRASRKEIGAIIFQKKKNINDSRCPREQIFVLPNKNSSQNGNLLDRYHLNSLTDLTIYSSNYPVWDEKHQSHVLDFFGRAKQGSIKNFQLINKNDPDKIVFFQIGKVNDTHFNLDFQYPLSPLQAFMIGLSSFDFKLQS